MGCETYAPFSLCLSKIALTRILHAPEAFIGKALKGAAVVDLLQALDNAAGGHLRERPQGWNFICFLFQHIYYKA